MEALTDRRSFLKDAGTLTVSAALLGPLASAIVSAATPDRPRISAVLFDSRYSSSRGFAGALVRQGAASFDARSDIASLWYGPLRTHLAEYGGCVAGLTTHSDFVLSQSFGTELRLVSRYEGSHDGRASSTLAHKLRICGSRSEIEGALERSASDWAESLGGALARTPWAESAAQWESSVVYTSRADRHPGFLRSWVLVPAF
jgi:hypothetical protein